MSGKQEATGQREAAREGGSWQRRCFVLEAATGFGRKKAEVTRCAMGGVRIPKVIARLGEGN